MAEGIICQSCGVEAPTRYVEFHQNIGALVVRFHQAFKGNLCKRCLHQKFWKMTGVTAAVGWAGMISLVLAPAFVLNNLARYIAGLGMPAVPPGAKPPQVTNEVIARIYPRMGEIFERLSRGEPLEAVARDLAPKLNVTPGELLVYVVHVVQANRQPPAAVTPPPAGGFPVIQSSPPPLPGR